MKKEKRDLLIFGYGLTLILMVIGIRVDLKYSATFISCACGLVALWILYLTILKQDYLKIVYTYWMKGAHFIGDIISGGIMVIIFYGMFAPIAMFLRLAKKDFLNRKMEPEAKTYWNFKEQKPFNRDDCIKQF